MADPSSHGAPPAGLADLVGHDALPAASSLMSSRWSRDNLITGHPGRLYDGKVLEGIGLETLPDLIRELEATGGPVGAGAGRMGVSTWDIACAGRDGEGPFTLQVPRALDEPGPRGRARAEVPRRNFETMRQWRARGLDRFVLEPRALITLAGNVPAATFAALPDHHPVGFGAGALGVELGEGRLSWVVFLGGDATADLLCEMVAALAYHYDYDPATGVGTTLADVSVNDGDFVARRRSDGSFEVRLTAARRQEPGIGPSLLLLYLVQLMAYEDFSVDGNLVGLPVLISNPSVAFAGVVRGRGYRFRDLGGSEEEGARQAREWIRDFGRSQEGRAYRPWVERFLAGRLPPTFGEDLRERWWRLSPLLTKLGILELRARLGHDGADGEAVAARTVRAFLDRISREVGRVTLDEEGVVRINDLGRDRLLATLAEAHVAEGAREGVADELLAGWPYRSFDHLIACVPGARALRVLKGRLSFGRVVSSGEQGTVKSLGPPPSPSSSWWSSSGADGTRPDGAAGVRRAIANAEIFGNLVVPPSLHTVAARTFLTFESYMDTALHDPTWGYYAHRVSIGKPGLGHFNTNPEDLSPHYGRWIATRAFETWREMVARGELTAADEFPIVEFGAGNGRLARDFLDALVSSGSGRPSSLVAPVSAAAAANVDPDAWRTFATRVRYRIYETSAFLRERQRALVGEGAVVAEGDARRPAEMLARDFPGGLRGFVVTNEVPDAFGVHKVVLTERGHALVALVVPRVEPALLQALGADHRRAVTAADGAARATFGFAGNAGDLYLDGPTFRRMMEAIVQLPAEEAKRCLAHVWFEETYVPVAAAAPELGAHLAANAAAYALALAAEDTGVVIYVNVHASRFMRDLGGSLAAGLIVTIDYGDTTWGLIHGARRGEFPFRVYGDWQDFVPRPNDPYAAPGTQDLTADVNFTDLAAAGRAAGLEVVHYGAERDLLGQELPKILRAAAEQEPVAEFLGSAVFKILVLGKRPSAIFAAPFASPLPLASREQDVPKARRSHIARIAETLASLAAPA